MQAVSKLLSTRRMEQLLHCWLPGHADVDVKLIYAARAIGEGPIINTPMSLECIRWALSGVSNTLVLMTVATPAHLDVDVDRVVGGFAATPWPVDDVGNIADHDAFIFTIDLRAPHDAPFATAARRFDVHDDAQSDALYKDGMYLGWEQALYLKDPAIFWAFDNPVYVCSLVSTAYDPVEPRTLFGFETDSRLEAIEIFEIDHA